MGQETVNIGSSANDGTGDNLRAAGTKINANFTELYHVTADGDIDGGPNQFFVLAVYARTGWDLDLSAGLPANPGDDGFTVLLSTQNLNNQNGNAGSGGVVQMTPAAGGDVDTGDGNAGKGGLCVIQPGAGGSNAQGSGDGGDGGDVYIVLPDGGNGNGGGTSGRKGQFFIQGLQNFADDAAAAAGGVDVNGLYLTSGAVKIRLS